MYAFIASGCSVAKLEARLEANPQCKEVVNPKTGALMPCPGSDKSFYREVGLVPAKTGPVANDLAPSTTTAVSATSATKPAPSTQLPANTTKAITSQGDCKPQIHKKTGGTLPCPAPD